MSRLKVTSVVRHVMDPFVRELTYQEPVSYEDGLLDDTPEAVEVFVRDIMQLQDGYRMHTSLECINPEASIRYNTDSFGFYVWYTICFERVEA